MFVPIIATRNKLRETLIGDMIRAAYSAGAEGEGEGKMFDRSKLWASRRVPCHRSIWKSNIRVKHSGSCHEQTFT